MTGFDHRHVKELLGLASSKEAGRIAQALGRPSIGPGHRYEFTPGELAAAFSVLDLDDEPRRTVAPMLARIIDEGLGQYVVFGWDPDESECWLYPTDRAEDLLELEGKVVVYFDVKAALLEVERVKELVSC